MAAKHVSIFTPRACQRSCIGDRRLTVVVEVDAVASVGLDVSLERAGVGESRSNGDARDAAASTASGKAVTTAVDVVVLTSDDKGRAGEGGHLGGDGQGEELAEGHRLLGHLGEDGGAGGEEAGVQEGVDVGRQVAPGQVAGWQVLGDRGDGRVPLVDDVANLSGCDLLEGLVSGNVDADAAEVKVRCVRKFNTGVLGCTYNERSPWMIWTGLPANQLLEKRLRVTVTLPNRRG